MNLVNELQECADKEDVLTVLRKTKRLAFKLERLDINEWLEREQSGYPTGRDAPDYRRIATTLAMNTNGYVPAGYGRIMNGIQDIPSRDLTFPIPIVNPISTLLSWIQRLDEGQGLYLPAENNPEHDQLIRRCIHVHPEFSNQISFMLRLDPSQIRAVPEHIKDRVLDWACKLEAAGITGEGLSFSAKEKATAQNVTFNISNSHVEQLTSTGSNLRGENK